MRDRDVAGVVDPASRNTHEAAAGAHLASVEIQGPDRAAPGQRFGDDQVERLVHVHASVRRDDEPEGPPGDHKPSFTAELVRCDHVERAGRHVVGWVPDGFAVPGVPRRATPPGASE